MGGILGGTNDTAGFWVVHEGMGGKLGGTNDTAEYWEILKKYLSVQGTGTVHYCMILWGTRKY